jgi:hypothetical protein
MPSGDPSEDPKADMDITGDNEPLDYAMNDFLIEKAECADQVPGASASRKTAKKKTAMIRLQKQAGYRR